MTVNSGAASFGAVVPKVGDRFTYTEIDKTLAGNTVVFPLSTHVVTALTTAGWNEDFVNPDPVVMSTVNFNSFGNRIGCQASANDPGGCRNALFTPEERLLDFSLFQGKTYGSSWRTSCEPDSQLETFSAAVGAYEQVTTAAGVFLALRIETNTVRGGPENSGRWISGNLASKSRSQGRIQERAYDKEKQTEPLRQL